MKYLLENWNSLEKKLSLKPILLLLDYDGTLTPIASKPQYAKLNTDVRKILRLLAKRKKITLGIISGRKIQDLKKLINIKEIYYAGNHGFEIKGPGVNFIHSSISNFKNTKRRIKKALEVESKSIKGTIVEDKGATLSFHYRLVDKKSQKRAREIFLKVCKKCAHTSKINITKGKKVLEIRPPVKWNKANAVSLIKKLANISKGVIIYAGDDETDEDVFRHLRKKDFSIYIGRKKHSKADYFLRNPLQLKHFLNKLTLLK